MNVRAVVDSLGFLRSIHLGTANCPPVSDISGVYLIFDRQKALHVGMVGHNGNSSTRKRLRGHSTGEVANAFAQYMLFSQSLEHGRESATKLTINRPLIPRFYQETCTAHPLIVGYRMIPGLASNPRGRCSYSRDENSIAHGNLSNLQPISVVSRSRIQAFRLPSVSPEKSTTRGARACSSINEGGL